MKFLKYFFSSGLPFGVSMGFCFGLSYDLVYGLIVGVVAGVLFGSFMAIVTIKRNKKQQILKKSVSDIDEIVFDSYANHIAGDALTFPPIKFYPNPSGSDKTPIALAGSAKLG